METKKPGELLLLPILFESNLIGVIELGVLKSFSELEEEYLKQVISNMGIVLNGIMEKNRTEQLSQEINNQIQAINSTNATIEFDLSGNIITANSLFLEMMGYEEEEIKGKHHRMFVSEEFGKSNEYKYMWDKLRKGELLSGEFERIRKDDSKKWLKGSYNALIDSKGDLYGVLKTGN